MLYLIKDPKQTATHSWISDIFTKKESAGRTVPIKDPLKEETPVSTRWGG